MKLAYEQAEETDHSWCEVLANAVDLGLPGLFNVEWLINRANRSESGKLWF